MAAPTIIPPAPPPGIPQAAPAGNQRSRSDGQDHSLFGADGLTFRDLLDIINPLQHLPVISNVYREFTGDELSPGARLMGGGLFGGFIGLGVAMFNSVVEDLTGKDVGSHVIALFRGDGDEAATAQVMMAAAEAPPTKAVVTANAASSSPIAEPMPALPAPIAPVHREELPPPVKSATSAPARAAGGPVRPRPHPAGYLMNTELLNLLIFSVPVEVGAARSDPGKTGPGEDPGQDRTSVLPGPDIPPVIAHQAYRHGAHARAVAVAGATPGAAFVPLGPAEHL